MTIEKKYNFTNERDLSILIIDDEDVVLHSIEKILQHSNPNYFIKTAKSVEEALDLVKETYWDTILLDISLPEKQKEKPDIKNGLYLLDILTKQLKLTPPIIAMTGYGDEDLPDTVLDKGAYYFLNKPVKPKSLAAIVNNATKLQEAGFDGLTGLLNRKTFEERLKTEFERVKRKNEKINSGQKIENGDDKKSYLSIIFVDGDNFKNINDSYTHLVGDQVLKKISSLFIDENVYKHIHKDMPNYANIIRPYDVASRFGGDEFTIFLPETNQKNAFLIAQRIRNMIKSFDMSEIVGSGNVKNNARDISLSIGIATYPEPNYVQNHRELIELADSAMYAAKKKREGEIFCFTANGRIMLLNQPHLFKKYLH